MMSTLVYKYLLRSAIFLLVSEVFFSGADGVEAGRKEIRVAVATNFFRPMDEVAGHFEKETGILVKHSSSATGMLYAQIVNGAPFDLFLAADGERPELLYQQELCEKPFVYASGKVVLWSGREDLDGTENWIQVLLRDDILRIAIANPETAPYGEAAMQAIKKAGIEQKLQKRLVYGQNIAQTFQYGQQGAADMAFVALSYALSEQGRKGRTWMLPEGPPVVQKGCILKNSAQKESVREFIVYLQTEQTKNILSAFGYE